MTQLMARTIRAEDTKNPTSRRTATAVGVLFVVQMVTAMVGTSFTEAFLAGDAGRATLLVGVVLVMCAGLAVVGIGLLMYPVLKAVSPGWAVWYPVLRVVECLVSAVCGIYLLARSEAVPNQMLWVYVPTGLGGMILTSVMFASRLVPRPIALIGLVGYVALTLGVPLDLLGVLDMSAGAGLLLLVPGGLFELVLLPIWLISQGFSASRSSGVTPLRAW